MIVPVILNSETHNGDKGNFLKRLCFRLTKQIMEIKEFFKKEKDCVSDLRNK